MRSFQSICVDNGVTFEEIVRVVKHLLFWSLGKVIYPISPSSIYKLTPKAASAFVSADFVKSEKDKQQM